MSAIRRLFFGLELPTSLQQEIVTFRATHFAAQLGRPVTAANLHITLAFLGEISEQKQAVLTMLAGRIQQPTFTLRLDDAGHWPRSSTVWLGMRQPPRGLLQLANLLRAQAARNGCTQWGGDFHPHITLYRQAPADIHLPPVGFCLTHSVKEFVLFESNAARGRTQYRALKRWPLKLPT